MCAVMVLGIVDMGFADPGIKCSKTAEQHFEAAMRYREEAEKITNLRGEGIAGISNEAIKKGSLAISGMLELEFFKICSGLNEPKKK